MTIAAIISQLATLLTVVHSVLTWKRHLVETELIDKVSGFLGQRKYSKTFVGNGVYVDSLSLRADLWAWLFMNGFFLIV